MNKEKSCYTYNEKSCIKPEASITDEEKRAFTLFNLVSAKASANALIDYVQQQMKAKTLSNRTAALLLRGALIDFGGGDMYDNRQAELIKLMKGLGKWNFMYQFEREIFKTFQSETLNIYRSGMQKSMFWTLNKISAEIHFAKYKELDFIWSGTIKRDEIIFFAHFDNGLIDFSALSIIQLNNIL